MALVCNGYMLAGRSRDGLRRCHHQKSMDAPVGNMTVVSDPVIPVKNGNVAKSVTQSCLAGYNNSAAAKVIQFFSLYNLATNIKAAWPLAAGSPTGPQIVAGIASAG